MPVTVPEQRRQTKGVGDCDKKRKKQWDGKERGGEAA